MTDQFFSSSRDVLQAKRRRLKAEGKGNRPNRSSTITDEMVQKLWNSEELGAKNGKTLQNTLFFFMTSCFGFRGSHESRQLTWGDNELKEDENGLEYLEFSERLTKTRTGGGTVGLLGLRCSQWVGTGVQSICTSSMSLIGPPL